MLMGPALAYRLFQIDLFQFIVESTQISDDQLVELDAAQWLRALLANALLKPSEALAQRIRAHRVAYLDLVAIVELLCLLCKRLGAPTLRVLALGQVFK